MITKKKAFEKWLEALTSGEYAQTKGALCRMTNPAKGPEGPKEYCCVGVLDEVVFETSWRAWKSLPGGADILVDDEGEDGNISLDRIAFMDLDRTVTPQELEFLEDYIDVNYTNVSRLAMLAALNDGGVDFDTIAMLIGDSLDWVNY